MHDIPLLGQEAELPRLLHTVRLATEVLETSVDPQQAAWTALVALTSGNGLGFNRAFLLLAQDQDLRGWFGVGPRTRQDADSLWAAINEVDAIPLDALLHPDPATVSREQQRHRETLQVLSTALPETGFDWHRPTVARRDHPDPCVVHWLAALDSWELAVLPLATRSGPWGVVLADNFVTSAPISRSVLDAAETLVRGLRSALDRALLLNRLHEESRHRLAAEHATALVETARTLAHDLKNPLSLAGGLARELLEAPASEPETSRRHLSVIVQAVAQAETRVAELVDSMARQAAPVVLEPVEVGAAASQVCEAFRSLAASRGLRLVCYHPARSLLAVAHPGYLDRCLENLVGNAIESCAGRGHQVQVAAREAAGEVVIEVSDDGPPLPASLRSNPFAGGLSGRGPGSGLGLLSVRRLTEAMGGRVEYDDSHGGWVRFAVVLRRWQ